VNPQIRIHTFKTSVSVIINASIYDPPKDLITVLDFLADIDLEIDLVVESEGRDDTGR